MHQRFQVRCIITLHETTRYGRFPLEQVYCAHREVHVREARVVMAKGRNLSCWTANQQRFLQKVRNRDGKVKWATFCIQDHAWVALDPGRVRNRIKECSEETPSPQPPFNLALINTVKQQFSIDDASDDENSAPAEQQQPRSPLRQILLAPVMAMMAMASPSKSKGSLRNDT